MIAESGHQFETIVENPLCSASEHHDSDCHDLTLSDLAQRFATLEVLPAASWLTPNEKRDRLVHADETGIVEDTTTNYLRRWATLQKQIAAWRGSQPDEVSPREAADWLSFRSTDLRASSWRQYKAAVVAGMIARGLLTPQQAEEFRSTVTLQALDNAEARRNLPIKTSHRTRKRLDDEELALLIAALQHGKGQYDAALAALVEAGQRAGLRPCEWAKVRLVRQKSGVTTLLVRNAKSTNGRSHGMFRRLHWSTVNDGEHIQIIERWIKIVDRWLAGTRASRRKQLWLEHRIKLRDRFADVCRGLWPRRTTQPSLYTTRHIFAAAAKERYTRIEVAALLGHAVDETATSHYARPARGKRRPKNVYLPEPSVRDISRVREAPKFEPSVTSRDQRPLSP